MRRFLLLVLVSIFSAPFVLAAPGAVRCGKLLDVRSGRELSDQIIFFDEQGIITSVTPASSSKLPAGVTPIDLSGATCLPGLLDVHTHLTTDPSDTGYRGSGFRSGTRRPADSEPVRFTGPCSRRHRPRGQGLTPAPVGPKSSLPQ